MTAKLISEAAKGLQFKEPPIFERGTPGRSGASIAKLDVPEVDVAAELGALSRKVPAALPEVSEPEAIRHFVRLSQWNFSIDTQFYPLGSCTMKHNPKVNEWAARLDGFANLHPHIQIIISWLGENIIALFEKVKIYSTIHLAVNILPWFPHNKFRNLKISFITLGFQIH